MSFDIARTPSLEAVAMEDEQRLAAGLQKRVEEAMESAESDADVVAAREAHRAAEEKLAALRKAERSLTVFAKTSREQAAVAARNMLDALIESAGAGEAPEVRKLSTLAAMESQHQFAMRAIERLVEHLIPLGEIAALREESHALLARARASESAAQERAEKLLGKMRDAVSDEMVLPIDLSKGVAGALLANADVLRNRAVRISANADELERAYSQRRTR
jgi:hypothetical protein